MLQPIPTRRFLSTSTRNLFWSLPPPLSAAKDMLELFQNVAPKMDLKTAVERGVLVPIRCVRVKTNIAPTDVRINGIKYNSQDLESKLFIPERNWLIVDTYLRCR